jgi:hypothetical protein
MILYTRRVIPIPAALAMRYLKRSMSKPAINFLLLVVMLLIISPFGFVSAQEASQTVTLDIIPVGIEGDASGTVSLDLPVGYQFWGAYPNESNWGTETASWQDYCYLGTRVIQTVTYPDGNSDEWINDEIDGVGFGGGVVYIRGDADISTEAEKNQRPYIEGEIISEGTVMVSDYQGYYYLSTRIKEETGEWEWVYGYNSLALRVALSQTEPLYTLWLRLWTWGPVDFTDSQGVRYTFILDGQQVMATHRQYLEMMLSTITINWTPPSPTTTAPSATPTAPPPTTPSLTTTVDTLYRPRHPFQHRNGCVGAGSRLLQYILGNLEGWNQGGGAPACRGPPSDGYFGGSGQRRA